MADERTLEELGKTMQQEINELGVLLYEMQEDYTIKLLRDDIMPTKVELEKQKMLTKQFNMLVKLHSTLKKSNKVGEINTTEFENTLREIMKTKSSMGDIVVSVPKD